LHLRNLSAARMAEQCDIFWAAGDLD
jgi:hypothetical protein